MATRAVKVTVNLSIIEAGSPDLLEFIEERGGVRSLHWFLVGKIEI